MKMNDFLKQIAMDMNINNREFNSDDFYYLLKYVGVKKDNTLANDIEMFYNDFVKNLDNSLVKYTKRMQNSGDNKTNYIGFYTSNKALYTEAVKVYFPVKYEYMISALKTIFLYLVRNNIEAVVKFHLKATNEGIVIRFYKESDVLPFINYCNNNFILSELLLSTNPFIATIYGIGIVKDDNTKSTFNRTLSKLLEEYFNLLKSDQNIDRAGELDFLDFVMKRQAYSEDEIMLFNIREVEKSMKSILNRSNPLEKDLL